MKINLLLFTQVIHSLLESSMPLQSALSISQKMFTGQREQKFVQNILKKINEGTRFAEVLSNYPQIFPPLYISLVSIGESSGTMAEVFGRLTEYIKSKKKLMQKMVQALSYPVLVLFTAIIIMVILVIFVMPRLEEIFIAFTESSETIAIEMLKIKTRISFFAIIISILILLTVITAIIHKLNCRVALIIDRIILKLPFIKTIAMTLQMYDFCFSMKLLSSTHYPLVQSLLQAKDVITNLGLRKAVENVCINITAGMEVGKAFEIENIFPSYLTVWIKTAEQNGNTEKAFKELSDYYSNESENILTGIIQSAEPVFILITGALIISVIGQFVIPVFRLLGAL